MLRIYDVSLDVISELRPVIARIERHDRDLARQLKKASTSVPLNIAEGSFAHGGHRPERYQSACSSMRESQACCDAAIRAGYPDAITESLRAKMREVIGTLVVDIRRQSNRTRGEPPLRSGSPRTATHVAGAHFIKTPMTYRDRSTTSAGSAGAGTGAGTDRAVSRVCAVGGRSVRS